MVSLSGSLVVYVGIDKFEFVVLRQTVYGVAEFQVTGVHEVGYIFCRYVQVDGRHGVEVQCQYVGVRVIVSQCYIRFFHQIVCHAGGDFLFEQFHLLCARLIVYTEIVFFQRFTGHHLHPGVHAVAQFVAHQFAVVGRQFTHQLVRNGVYRIISEENLSSSVLQETGVRNAAFGVVDVFSVRFVHQVHDGYAVVSGDDGYVFAFGVKITVLGSSHCIVALKDKECACIVGGQFAVGGEHGQQIIVGGEGEAIDFIICCDAFAQFFGLEVPDIQSSAVGCRNEVIVVADGNVFCYERYLHLVLQSVLAGVEEQQFFIGVGYHHAFGIRSIA